MIPLSELEISNPRVSKAKAKKKKKIIEDGLCLSYSHHSGILSMSMSCGSAY